MWRGLSKLVILGLIFPILAQSDIGFLLHESIGNPWYPQKKVDTGFLTQGGHGAILVSDLCAESPTQIRKCRDGEQPGIVISRYDGLSNEEYDWMAVPVSWYFNGVPEGEGNPLFATKKVYAALAERFYDEFLSKSIARVEAGKLPPGRWQDTLAASFRRDIYNLSIKYSGDTQEKIVAPLMNNPNTSNFSFFVGNCSDFAADFFKTHYDNFTRTNLGDIGFTSPKGVAWSVAKLGHSFAPGEYQATKFSQTPGNVERSRENLYAIENMTKHPKWTALMLYFGPQNNMVQGGFLAWSLLFRFNAETEVKNHFSPQVSNLNWVLSKQYDAYDAYSEQIAAAKSRDDIREMLDLSQQQIQQAANTEIVKDALKIERNKFFGDDDQWENLKTTVKELKARYQVPNNLFDKLDKEGEFSWVGKSLVVRWTTLAGSKSVVFAGESVGEGDADLLRWIRIARLDYYVSADKKNRPQIATVLEELKLIEDLN